MRLCMSLLLVLHFMPAYAKTIYGYVEQVTLPSKSLQLQAKLDTGAKTASLHARRIRYVEKDGQSYVKFIVPTAEGEIPFMLPHAGDVSIKARSGEVGGVKIKNPFIRRPYVNMPIQIGSKVRTIKVNLANRKRFSYPVLLGREALVAFDGVVDPSMKNTAS